MPTLADSISMLKVGKKTFQNPEWWSSQHKLRKATKYNEIINKVSKKANFRTDYKVITLENQPPLDEYVAKMKSTMDLDRYEIYAPWDPIFKKSKTIITFWAYIFN